MTVHLRYDYSTRDRVALSKTDLGVYYNSQVACSQGGPLVGPGMCAVCGRVLQSNIGQCNCTCGASPCSVTAGQKATSATGKVLAHASRVCCCCGAKDGAATACYAVGIE
jgi:hypothetical protein